MTNLELQHVFYAFMSIALSLTILLGHVASGLGELFTEDGKINIKLLVLQGFLYTFSGLVSFFIALNAFNTTALAKYAEYQNVAAMIFGGFGTLVIPAIHKAVELAIEKALRKVTKWAREEHVDGITSPAARNDADDPNFSASLRATAERSEAAKQSIYKNMTNEQGMPAAHVDEVATGTSSPRNDGSVDSDVVAKF